MINVYAVQQDAKNVHCVGRSLLLMALLLLMWPRAAQADESVQPQSDEHSRKAAAQGGRTHTTLPDLSVELHAHLFMKPGLGWLYSGNFSEPLTADDWSDRLSCKTNAATLARSGIGIAVVALFAHPLYVGDMRDSIREQIQAAHKFAGEHEDWELARNAAAAERILRRGRRALVLSLEGASGVLESSEDLVEFIDEAGIAIVTPLHLVDDRFGGVATMDGYQRLANPLGLIDGLLDPQDSHVHTNPRGTTALGKRLVAELIARGVWIDLTHASDRAIADMLPLITRARQPFLYTHTTPRRYRSNERAISDAMLKRVAASRGIIGLLPSEDAFGDIVVSPRYCPKGCSAEACAGSLHALAQVFDEVGQQVGHDALVLGSDYNGGMRHLAAACRSGTSLDGEHGLWNIGQQAEVWSALRSLGAPVPPLRQTLKRFLATWSRVKPVSLKRVWPQGRSKPLPKRRTVAGPGAEVALSIGGAYLEGGQAAMSIGGGLVVLKDMARAYHGEPAFYFLKLNGRATSQPFSGELEYIAAYAAPVGGRAKWYDNRLWGDLASGRITRNLALDQAFVGQWLALRGGFRTMPGLLKKPGAYNLYLGIGAGVLGYKYLRTQRDDIERHMFVPAEGSAELGFSLWPNDGLRLTIFGEARADVAFARFSPLAFQSDAMFSSGLRMGLPDGVLEPYIDMRWLFTRFGTSDANWLETRQFQAGTSVHF